MRRFILFSIGISVILIVNSLLLVACDKEDINSASDCYKVRLGMAYCSGNNAILIYFDRANKFTKINNALGEQSSGNVAVVINFPVSAYKRDSIVYVQFKYDEQVEKEYLEQIRYCPAIYGPMRILSFEGISGQSCAKARLK